MAKTISIDLRERIVKAYKSGHGTYEEIASIFEIGRATVSRLLRRSREKKTLQPAKRPMNAPIRIGPQDNVRLSEIVQEFPDATVEELTAVWRQRVSEKISRSSMMRALLRNGFTLKKDYPSL